MQDIRSTNYFSQLSLMNLSYDDIHYVRGCFSLKRELFQAIEKKYLSIYCVKYIKQEKQVLSYFQSICG